MPGAEAGGSAQKQRVAVKREDLGNGELQLTITAPVHLARDPEALAQAVAAALRHLGGIQGHSVPVTHVRPAPETSPMRPSAEHDDDHRRGEPDQERTDQELVAGSRAGGIPAVAAAVARAHQLGRKFAPEDLDDSLRNAALAYAECYQGDFAFMQEMKVNAPAGLSDRQIVAVLNCLRAEVLAVPGRPTTEAAEEAPVDLSSVPPGCYAVDDGQGGLTFLRLHRPESGRWAGWILVDEVLGGEVTRARGHQRPGAAYRGPLASAVAAVVADPAAASARYGAAIGRCGLCGRALTTTASRMRGIGPICAERLGPPIPASELARLGSCNKPTRSETDNLVRSSSGS
ncbi:MAG: hypothetical protein KY439_01210 [Actinobacteria bacterium]|nr:hypothetical protein [Actinomycetota bacterium]